MPEGRRTSFNNPGFYGHARIRDRSVYALPTTRRPKPHTSVDGIVMREVSPAHKQPVKAPQTQLTQTQYNQSAPRPALPRQNKSAVLARHTVTTKRKKKSAYDSRKSRKSLVLILTAFTFFVTGTVASYLGWQAQNKAKIQSQVLAKSSESARAAGLSEDSVSQAVVGDYAVGPDLPRVVKIPRLQVEARVKRVGINTSGELETPSNVHDVGWYDGSVKPGREGTTFLNGHVQGSTKPGVFSRLNILKEGDSIQIERGDGKLINYKVVGIESVEPSKVDMEKILADRMPGKDGLTLMTSSSRYDVRTNQYEPRIVVYAIME